MGNPKNTTSAPNFLPSVLLFLTAWFLIWLLSVVPYNQALLDMIAMCAAAAGIAGVFAGLGAAGRSSE